MPLKSRVARGVAALVALALLGSGCADEDAAGTGQEGGSSIVNVSGSSTVAPISTRVAEFFEDVDPGAVVNVDGPGTGDGFVLFCEGETDISDASRPIKPEEADTCAENGIEFIELQVAIDGLSVITHPANDAVECLSFVDLYALTGPESQGFENWSDAQPLADELGSATRFPDANLDITAPGEESGTYDSYIEIALSGVAERRVEAGRISEEEAETTRPDYQSSGDDNIIIQGIQGSETSFGWVGFAFAEEAGEAIREIAISEEPGGECVEPNPGTIASGDYPLSRPLFIYVNAARADSKQAVADYVDFYLGDGIHAIEEVGYVALEDSKLEETVTAWENRETGSRVR